ncbi:MAG: S9 family peptidase [Sphingomonas sp.]|nr:S9 family peptidase [Sphingomonas sp.]
MMLGSSSVAAQELPVAAQLARDFGKRELVQSISLSPDGVYFAALVAGKGQSEVLLIGRVDGSEEARPILNADGDPERLTRCNWANNSRLICTISTVSGNGVDAVTFTRSLAIDRDGKNMKVVSARPGNNALEYMQNGGSVIDWFGDAQGSAVLMTRQFVPEASSETNIGSTQQGLGVERIDPLTLKRQLVERGSALAVEYITDGLGTVRIMGVRPEDASGYVKNQIRYRYRKPGSRDWLPLSTVGAADPGGNAFDPWAVDPTANVAYGFDTLDGRRALFKVALDGTAKRDLVFARPDVDIDGLIRIGRKNRVVGVSFATDRRQTAFFDPELKKLQSALQKAVPDLPLVSFVDSSSDESMLLIWMGSDVDPGRYMVYDKATRHLDQLVAVRPDLENRKLAVVKAVTVQAADGAQIPAYLTIPTGSDGKKLPAIVMPHGGPGARDEWGFDWLAQFFAARGYAVLQPNYRGSTGYGDDWFVENGFKSWRVAIGDVNDAGRWLIKEGIATPDHLAIVGWSYGGYAALQSSVLDPDLFKSIVAIAPVTDLDSWREELRGFKEYALRDQFIGNGPHVREGSPAKNAGVFKVPVLMFHGDRDQNVGIGESRLMASRLKAAGKAVELVEFKGLDHQLDDSEARATMLAKADAFLRTTMKLPE